MQGRFRTKEPTEILQQRRKVMFTKYNGKGRGAWATCIKTLKTGVFTEQENASALKDLDGMSLKIGIG